MPSPPFHSLLIQTRIDDRHQAISQPAAALEQPGGHDATSADGPTSRESRSTYRFLRHYAEMVAVMFLGMFALGMPADRVLHVFGASYSSGHPTMMLSAMAVTMTGPMVAWMRYRGHGWQASMEMAASMLIPTAAIIGLMATGLAHGVGMLMVIEHVAMLTCMLFAMLLRLDEYAGAAHSHGGTQRAVIA
jgi:hypothetical protein